MNLQINFRVIASACRLALASVAIGSVAVCTAIATPFELFVTQSPPGPQNQDPATWSGVLQYHATNNSGTLVQGVGIDKTNLADPAGLVFRQSTRELFVGNRHGNNNPSSIARFIFDGASRRLIPNGQIAGNGLYGVHQMAFNPVTGEMFAANVNSGVSRFTFDTTGNPTANGTISSGPARGVAVSSDGTRLYVTGASATIRQFDLISGTELTPVTVPSNVGGLHYFGFRGGQLYVAGLYDDVVYRYAVDANNNLTLAGTISMNDPAAIAFSPDGLEMFVSGHRTSDVIYRFKYQSDDTWLEEAVFDAQSSLGSILVIPSVPELSIARDFGNLLISWPLPDDGCFLEEYTTLPDTAVSWTRIEPPYQTNSSRAWITASPSQGNRFYRLIRP